MAAFSPQPQILKSSENTHFIELDTANIWIIFNYNKIFNINHT